MEPPVLARLEAAQRGAALPAALELMTPGIAKVCPVGPPVQRATRPAPWVRRGCLVQEAPVIRRARNIGDRITEARLPQCATVAPLALVVQGRMGLLQHRGNVR